MLMLNVFMLQAVIQCQKKTGDVINILMTHFVGLNLHFYWQTIAVLRNAFGDSSKTTIMSLDGRTSESPSNIIYLVRFCNLYEPGVECNKV